MRIRKTQRPELMRLETRVNCSIVTNTKDYKPIFEPTDLESYPIDGSLRNEIAEAKSYYIQNGIPDTITFDNGIDLNSGSGVSKFGGPIDDFNTIKLPYGSLAIDTPVIIRAPKAYDNKQDYVEVHWQGSLYPTSDDDKSGSDWSVFQVHVAERKIDDINTPTDESKYPNYNKTVEFTGLKITNGKAGSGGGIFARGYHTLVFNHTEISGNKTFRVPGREEQEKLTSGAGLFTVGEVIEFPDRTGIIYGPNVHMANSLVRNNTTATNDTAKFPATDRGGGMFLGFGSSLQMVNSSVDNNAADNDGGGIYFEGGAFLEYPDADGIQPVFSTFMRINNSTIAKNEIHSEIGKGSGGGIAVAGCSCCPKPIITAIECGSRSTLTCK